MEDFNIHLSLWLLCIFQAMLLATTDSGRQYILFPGLHTWDEVKEVCNKSGLNMLKIESQTELDNLVLLFSKWKKEKKDFNELWTGLHDEDPKINNRKYHWQDCTPLGAFRPWSRHEPNGHGKQNCVLITLKGKLRTKQCQKKLHTVCQRNIDDCWFESGMHDDRNHYFLEEKGSTSVQMCQQYCLRKSGKCSAISFRVGLCTIYSSTNHRKDATTTKSSPDWYTRTCYTGCLTPKMFNPVVKANRKNFGKCVKTKFIEKPIVIAPACWINNTTTTTTTTAATTTITTTTTSVTTMTTTTTSITSFTTTTTTPATATTTTTTTTTIPETDTLNLVIPSSKIIISSVLPSASILATPTSYIQPSTPTPTAPVTAIVSNIVTDFTAFLIIPDDTVYPTLMTDVTSTIATASTAETAAVVLLDTSIYGINNPTPTPSVISIASTIATDLIVFPIIYPTLMTDATSVTSASVSTAATAVTVLLDTSMYGILKSESTTHTEYITITTNSLKAVINSVSTAQKSKAAHDHLETATVTPPLRNIEEHLNMRKNSDDRTCDITKQGQICVCIARGNITKEVTCEKRLPVEKKILSSYNRSKTSAPDYRPSAVLIGSTGILLLSIIIGVPVFLDLHRLVLWLQKRREAKRHN